MKNQFSARGLLTCTSPGPRQPLDPGLVFLILSFEKFHPPPCMRIINCSDHYMVETFPHHGGIPLFENCQIRKSLSCAFETLAAACIFASRVQGEPLNLLLKKKSVFSQGASHLHLLGLVSPWFSLFRPPRWHSGKTSASRAEDPRFESCLRQDFFWGQVIPVTQKLALQWLPCQTPGVIGSAPGLVSPVSVYCDWVRWKVGSAASIVWQHVELSEQIRP